MLPDLVFYAHPQTGKGERSAFAGFSLLPYSQSLLRHSLLHEYGVFTTTGDFLCLATAGAPIQMEPFRDRLTASHKLPANHPREVWYDEITAGRIMTTDLLGRTSTYMHLAQHQIQPERMKPYRRSLWWLRHGANIEIESPLLAFMCFFNSLETLLLNEQTNRRAGKPKRNKKTKEQFAAIFGKDLGEALYQICYGDKGNSLYDTRNEVDHGRIVELGSGVLKVLGNMVMLKAVVVDLALYWIGQNLAVGGWMSKGILEYGADGLLILSENEALERGYSSSGLITL